VGVQERFPWPGLRLSLARLAAAPGGCRCTHGCTGRSRPRWSSWRWLAYFVLFPATLLGAIIVLDSTAMAGPLSRLFRAMLLCLAIAVPAFLFLSMPEPWSVLDLREQRPTTSRVGPSSNTTAS